MNNWNWWAFSVFLFPFSNSRLLLLGYLHKIVPCLCSFRKFVSNSFSLKVRASSKCFLILFLSSFSLHTVQILSFKCWSFIFFSFSSNFLQFLHTFCLFLPFFFPLLMCSYRSTSFLSFFLNPQWNGSIFKQNILLLSVFCGLDRPKILAIEDWLHNSCNTILCFIFFLLQIGEKILPK